MNPASPPRQIESTTLPNGLRVVSEMMQHVRSVSVGIWIATGARHETLKQNGLSHFLEHMVFKGTDNRSAEEIARAVDSTGGHLDAYTAKEMVSYNTKVLDEHLPLAFDVLADLVLHPTLLEEHVEREKSVILEELKSEVDNPEYMVHETFSSHFWKNHSLGRPILGTKSTIKSFNRDAVLSYYRSYYVPTNMVITAAGRIEHQRLVELTSKYFASIEAPPAEFADKPAATATPLILKNKRSLEQVHLCMGFPAFPIAHPKRYACYVLNTLLGGGMSSRLFQKIREQHGLAYSVFSELSLYRDAGCLAVYGGTSIEHVERVVHMVVEELRSLVNDPISDEELRRAKDHLKGSIALSLESTMSRMTNLARQSLFFDRFYTVDEMMDSLETVTKPEVQAVACDLFQGKQAALAILGKLNGLTIAPESLLC